MKHQSSKQQSIEKGTIYSTIGRPDLKTRPMQLKKKQAHLMYVCSF